MALTLAFRNEDTSICVCSSQVFSGYMKQKPAWAGLRKWGFICSIQIGSHGSDLRLPRTGTFAASEELGLRWFGHSRQSSCLSDQMSRSSLLQVQTGDQQHGHCLPWQKCNPPHLHMHFNKTPWWFICPLGFEEPWSRSLATYRVGFFFFHQVPTLISSGWGGEQGHVTSMNIAGAVGGRGQISTFHPGPRTLGLSLNL